MSAVFRHELRSYFHSLTAYVFGAFLLAVIGIGAMFYNLEAAVSLCSVLPASFSWSSFRS